VIGQFGGNSWCVLHPMMVEGANGKFQAQTVMIITKVIEAAGDMHTRHQGFGTARQCACLPHQVVEPQAKRGIEMFDESRVDYAFAILSSFDQVFDHFLATLHNTPVKMVRTPSMRCLTTCTMAMSGQGTILQRPISPRQRGTLPTFRTLKLRFCELFLPPEGKKRPLVGSVLPLT
jgi:hypothetical protein